MGRHALSSGNATKGWGRNRHRTAPGAAQPGIVLDTVRLNSIEPQSADRLVWAGAGAILLPLDGSPEGEEALPVATWIAGLTGARSSTSYAPYR